MQLKDLGNQSRRISTMVDMGAADNGFIPQTSNPHLCDELKVKFNIAREIRVSKGDEQNRSAKTS